VTSYPTRLLFILVLLVGPVVAEVVGQPQLFPTEQTAQQHCPADNIVWLNLRTDIYHFKGQRWYGRTKSGAYVCKQEANKAGDRGPLNGQ
jgi:hypothetical protein